MWRLIIFYFIGAFVLAGLQYVSGRIILPELGLDVPRFAAWLALAFLLEMPLMIINEILKEINKPARFW